MENQFDHQIYVSDHITRHKAGFRMEYNQTTPDMLAQAVIKNIGRKIESKAIPFDGAKDAAESISELLSGNR